MKKVLHKKKSFVKNETKKKFCQKHKNKQISAKISKIWAKKIAEFLEVKFGEVKFGEAKLIIGAANVICGEATWSSLIKTSFGHFNQLVTTILL